MGNINPAELNKKMQSTTLILIVSFSMILLSFWFFVFGDMFIPLVIVVLAFMLYFFVLSRKIKQIIYSLGEKKE
ncbi:MAG: hypothetical protein ABIH83_00555 [Candidatus Micrarchaeota archaeon]